MPGYSNLSGQSMWGAPPYNPLGIPASGMFSFGTSGVGKSWGKKPTQTLKGKAAASTSYKNPVNPFQINTVDPAEKTSSLSESTIWNPTFYSSISNPNSTNFGHTINPNYVVPQHTPKMGPMPPKGHPSYNTTPLSISTHPPQHIDYGAWDSQALIRNQKAQDDWKAEWAKAVTASRNAKSAYLAGGGEPLIITGYKG
jgi:hypothetical protein